MPDVTPTQPLPNLNVFDVRRLMKSSDQGGAQAEAEYGEFHRKRGVKLKAKYTGGK